MSMASLNFPSLHKRLMRPSLVLDLKKVFSIRGLFSWVREDDEWVLLKQIREKDLEILRVKDFMVAVVESKV